jgi:cellulose biosynthesis protein BcsQ
MASKPKVIMFGNKKGGVGKTTHTIHTAGILSHYGHRVLVIDQDTQQSVFANYNRRKRAGEKSPAYDYHYQWEPLTQERIQELGEGYDFILIDSPPGTEDGSTGRVEIRKSTPQAFLVSDLVVMPFKMGSNDVDSGLSYVNYFRRHYERQVKIPGKSARAIVVPNDLRIDRAWSTVYSGVNKVMLKWADSGVTLSDVIIWNYSDYDRTQFAGMTAADLPRSRPRILFEKLVFEKFCEPLGIPDPRSEDEKLIANEMVSKSWAEAKVDYEKA